MNKASVLVVDDEPLARRRLVRMLAKLDWVGAIEEATNAAEAIRAVPELTPDILLLDIQMPGGSGFDVLERLGPNPPAVVFVTAFDTYALQAFETNAVDYVTKPVEPSRFALALARARRAVESQTQTDRLAELQETVAALRSALSKAPKRRADFWIRARGDYLRVAVDSVIRFQAERDYVRIHTADGTSYLYQDSMAALEKDLEAEAFIRIHRSTIVRRDAVSRLRAAPFGALVAILVDGTEVRVGRTYGAAVRARLMQG